LALTDALADLDEAVGAFIVSGGGDSKAILSAVFRLNNEIGKLLRPSGDPVLKSLQLRVNDVTMAAKQLDRKRLAEAMERVRADALRLQLED